VRGHHDEAIARLERGLSLAVDDDAATAAIRMMAFAGLGRHYTRRGRPDVAQARFQASFDIARVLGDRRAMAFALYALGGAETNKEQYDRAVPYLEQALAIYEEREDQIGICGSHYFRGIGAYGQGRLVEGVADIEVAVRVRRSRGPIFNLSILLNALGLLQSELGEIEPAISALTESRTIWQSAAGTNREVQAEWLAVVAFLERRRRQPWLAARLGGAAESLTEAVNVPLLVPPPRQYARWVAELREELGEAVFEGAWSAGRALSVDQAVGEALAPSPVLDEGIIATLSPRELEVLTRIARGKSDRAIADELFLSVRTVEGHVSRLLAKLGVRSRAEAMRLVLTDGLSRARERN
jgi:non-specific serine/threonine protein kinase